ncbi:MAG: ABC transporter permease subunit [Gammaproteobacteria bacterium]|nr:ABC transporter permease subunit [Gammaproteobacteria bacterium]
MLAPALVVIGGLFGGGLADALAQSFGWFPALGMHDLELDAWRAVLRDPAILHSLLLTLYVAATTTAISTILAVALALALRGSSARLPMAILHLPITIPYLLAAVGITLLVSQSGLLARVIANLGFIDEPRDFPPLVYDPYAIGIILTYVWKETPFITLITLALLRGAPEELEQVARTLGATRRQCLRHVILPRIMSGLLAAAFVAFAFTFGAFEVPLLLGETSPPTLPVLAWYEYQSLDLADRPTAMAVALIIAIVTGVLAVVLLRLSRRFFNV